jgi:hypothetical protein
VTVAVRTIGTCRTTARMPPRGGAIYIVIITWTYVIGMMALTWDSVAGGLAFFAVVGLAPALFVLWIAARRARTRAGRGRSVLQREVRGGDDADAEADQR